MKVIVHFLELRSDLRSAGKRTLSQECTREQYAETDQPVSKDPRPLLGE